MKREGGAPWAQAGAARWLFLAAAFLVPVLVVPRPACRDMIQHVLMLAECRRAQHDVGSFEVSWALVPGSLFEWLARPWLGWLDPWTAARLALGAYVAGCVLAMGALTRALRGRSGRGVSIRAGPAGVVCSCGPCWLAMGC